MLVADSGGTKTDWLLAGDVECGLQTPGLNPSSRSPDQIRAVLFEDVRPWLSGREPSEIRFFGAGLGTPARQQEMHALLSACFPDCASIRVDSDLLAAALACLGDRPGVAGILGTGSVAFHYDGQRITRRRGGHGFLLGDVGGGPSLGSALVRALADGDLPDEIVAAHVADSGLEVDAFRDELYASPDPTRLLAARVPFLAAHRHEPAVREIIEEPIRHFLEQDLRPLCEVGEPVVLMGGIATEFAEIVTALATRLGLGVTILWERPIRALANHLTRSKPLEKETTHALRDRF